MPTEPFQPGNSARPSIVGDLTLVEVARRLGMPVRTVNRWAFYGLIPSTLASEGTWRFRPEDLGIVGVRRRDDPGDFAVDE